LQCEFNENRGSESYFTPARKLIYYNRSVIYLDRLG